VELLFRQHSDQVLAYALGRGASRGEAEEVVSQVFLISLRRIEDVPVDALPWLLGVARRVLANHWRSKRRSEALQVRLQSNFSAYQPAAAQSYERRLLATRLFEGLTQLSEPDREALLLVAWDGLSHAEAAQVLDCSRPAFALRVYRARQRLLKYFGNMRTLKEQEATPLHTE